MLKILSLSTLIILTLSIMNPGILITIPFPLQPPSITLPLPLKINNILISNLQLTNINLNQLQYVWKLNTSNAQVNASQLVFTFDWFYKSDKGKGIFTQEGLKLIFQWNFTMTTRDNRFKIDIINTHIHPGKSHVHLGGNIKQNIAVEVTNLILNHASIIFRGIIGNKLSQTLSDFSSIIGKDIQIFHDQQTNKNIKINTTLVAFPLISSNVLYLQVNGASYVQGESSGYLNPSDILVRNVSNKISVQVHKQMINRIIESYLKIKTKIRLQIISSQITSVVRIDTLALSPVFPPLAYLQEKKDVVFDIQIPQVIFSLDEGIFSFLLKGQCIISTKGFNDQVHHLYMNPIKALVEIRVKPIFGAILNNIRLDKLEILQFLPEEEDIEKNLILPEKLTQYFPQFMEWVKQAVNLELNRKTIKLSYQNIIAKIKGESLKNISYNLELDLY